MHQQLFFFKKKMQEGVRKWHATWVDSNSPSTSRLGLGGMLLCYSTGGMHLHACALKERYTSIFFSCIVEFFLHLSMLTIPLLYQLPFGDSEAIAWVCQCHLQKTRYLVHNNNLESGLQDQCPCCNACVCNNLASIPITADYLALLTLSLGRVGISPAAWYFMA